MTPAQLASQVLSLAVFKRVTQDDYRILLRHLIGIDHIETTERGGLIVGVAAGTSTVSVTVGDATYQLAVTVK